MTVTQLNKIKKASQAALQAMVSEGNVAFSGQGAALWTLNADVKYDILCTIAITKSGTYHAIPIMDDVKNDDGSQASTIHFYAGTFYSEMETFQKDDEVLVSVVQRIPNEDITSDDLIRIDAWAAERNEAEGRVTSTRATDAYRLSKKNDQVTYAITNVAEAA